MYSSVSAVSQLKWIKLMRLQPYWSFIELSKRTEKGMCINSFSTLRKMALEMNLHDNLCLKWDCPCYLPYRFNSTSRNEEYTSAQYCYDNTATCGW
jgi:hypothetical protein